MQNNSARQDRLKGFRDRRVAMEALRQDRLKQQQIGQAMLAWAQAVWSGDPRAALLLQNAKLSALHCSDKGG